MKLYKKQIRPMAYGGIWQGFNPYVTYLSDWIDIENSEEEIENQLKEKWTDEEMIKVTHDRMRVLKFEYRFVEYTDYMKPKSSIKKSWSEWKFARSGERSEDGRNIIIQVRENGKKVQVRGCGYKAEATCCAEDTFDFNKGFELAKRRWVAKRFCGQVEDFAKSL